MLTYHYITEHGVVPAECGVTDTDEAWRFTRRMPEETYQLTIKGLDAEANSVRLIDPITGRREQLQPTGDAASLRVEVKVADYPRLLVVQW